MSEVDAPSTPRMEKPVEHEVNPRSPLLFIPSPARARASPEQTRDTEHRDLTSSMSKLAKLPQLSRLNANAKEFIPAIYQVPTALRVRSTTSLPPVISVKKMANKGCAIVLLRDDEVIELAARMAVAVIDGVCVELRRHSRRSKREDADEAGIFVAWGHRVERRATVSEEGLEAYFNGLSSVSDPETLSFQPPFQESLLLFPLSSSKSVSFAHLIPPQVAEANGEVLLNGPHDRRDLVQQLWDAKVQLDELWNKPPPPKARSVMQRVARDQLFPHSGKEGSHENRAGEKLEELAKAVGLMEDLEFGDPKSCRFLDLCGGPGAWSHYFLQMNFRGYGFTLRSGAGGQEDWQAEQKDDWYPELLRHPNWQALWGADGTGDLLKPENLQQLSQRLSALGKVSICVADGGFSDKAIPPNLLELYFYRLFLAEILTAANCLLPGGLFVCKLYSSFSMQTSVLLFLLTRLFEDVQIVKPMSSRVAGPERYLYAKHFRQNEEVELIKKALWKSHLYGQGQSPLQLPLLTPLLGGFDDQFRAQLQEMVVTLCMRQAGALRAIHQRAEALEEMALDVAEEARNGEELWAEAAKKQREQQQQEKLEKLEKLEKPSFAHVIHEWKQPQVTKPRYPRSMRLWSVSAEFNRWQ